MVRSFICEKSGLKKGTWTQEEDERLISCIRRRGPCNWREIPNDAGLLRCGKSCRLRWLNYLRPSIKRGNFTREEDHQILILHGKLGNKWSKIAASLPGRTDNEIKNYYHTHLKKRLKLDTNLKMKDKPRECEAVRKKVLAPRSFHRDDTGLEPQILESWPLNLLSKQETQDLSMNTVTNQTTLSSEMNEELNGKSLIEYMRDESTSAFREPWFTSHPFSFVSANTDDDVDIEACFSSLTSTTAVPQQMNGDDFFTDQHVWVTPLSLSESLYPNGQYDDHDMDALFEYQLVHTAY